MNQKHLLYLCDKLQLGLPDVKVTSIDGSRGGSFIWRVNTEKGSYAIKQLAPVIDIKNEKIIAKYELCETIAHRFSQQGILTVCALNEFGKHLFMLENIGYLVYPWVEGAILARNEISEMHALKVAEIIAKLHNINLNVPEIKEPRFDIYSNDNLVDAIDKAILFKYPFAKILKENQKLILSINDSYFSAIPILKEQNVVSHCDVDQLNIIWDKKDKPILIDWETARKINPTFEVVRTSLGWAGLGAENFSVPLYTHMLQIYKKSGGVLNIDIINAALHGAFGGMINWILYNIAVAYTSAVTEEKNTAADEINSSMISMKRLKILIPELSKIL